MNLQIIKSINGKNEYVLLPISVYAVLRDKIEKEMQNTVKKNDYVSFNPADYVDNPVALARIKANITQEELAKAMNVSQAYISKIERQEKVTLKLLNKIKNTLKVMV